MVTKYKHAMLAELVGTFDGIEQLQEQVKKVKKKVGKVCSMVVLQMFSIVAD